jgi:hypothetical protein
VNAVYLSDNPVHHKRTKHVELHIHFVRERTALGQLRVLHVPTRHQYADIMTKGLPTPLFEEFRDSLCIQTYDAVTVGWGVLANHVLHSPRSPATLCIDRVFRRR